MRVLVQIVALSFAAFIAYGMAVSGKAPDVVGLAMVAGSVSAAYLAKQSKPSKRQRRDNDERAARRAARAYDRAMSGDRS